jgi:hypothetical protein
MVGKRLGQSLAATSAPGHQPSRLFYVTNRNSDLRFLVDTGAEASVIPAARTDRKHQQDGPVLQAVNGTPIATYGKRSLTLDLGLRHTFRWVFTIADIKAPILDANFLRYFSLLVGMRKHRLSDALTQLKIQGITTHDASPSPIFLPTRHQNEHKVFTSNFPPSYIRVVVNSLLNIV